MKIVVVVVALTMLWVPGGGALVMADVVGPHSSLGPTPTLKLSQWERELVGQWLLDYGIERDQAAYYLAALDDTEIHDLVIQAENQGLPYGGGALEFVIAILIILILVIIILKLMNKEVVIG